MTNPLYSISVSDTICLSCSSSSTASNCIAGSGFIESATALTVSFKANSITACSYCSLVSSSIYNGINTATMTFKIITVNPVAANGALRLFIPYSNFNYMSMGSFGASGFLTMSNPLSATITVSYGTAGSTSLTPISLGTSIFKVDTTGSYIDNLIIPFASSPLIASGQ